MSVSLSRAADEPGTTQPADVERVSASTAPQSEAEQASASPDVVILVADDVGAWLTGVGGHPQVKTPALDGLAGRGVYWSRCYTTIPQGLPARASLLTGMQPHAVGVMKPGDVLDPYVDTFMRRLQRAGYDARILGLWIAGDEPVSLPEAPPTTASAPATAPTEEPIPSMAPPATTVAEPTDSAPATQPMETELAYSATAPAVEPAGATPTSLPAIGSAPAPPPGPFGPPAPPIAATQPTTTPATQQMPHPEPTASAESHQPALMPVALPEPPSLPAPLPPAKPPAPRTARELADEAVKFIEHVTERPYVLWVGFPSILADDGTGPDLTAYPPAEVELPGSRKRPLVNIPAPLQQSAAARAFQRMNDAHLQTERAKAYARLTTMDEQIGRIVRAIEQAGRADRTVLVVVSAHGVALGEHRLWGAGPAFYEEMVRVPMIVQAPGGPAGLAIDRVVSLVDVAPTVLALAGQQTLTAMHGVSLLPIMADPRRLGHGDEAFVQYHQDQNAPAEVRAVISRSYKLVDYLTSTDEFFDLQRDPGELFNATAEPEYMPVMNVLRERLKFWQQETRDPSAR